MPVAVESLRSEQVCLCKSSVGLREMTRFITFALLFASCVLLINGQFSKNLDNLNVDMILKNDRILSNYLKCVLDKGPCTNEGRDLKSAIPELLNTGCKTCTDKQKRNSRKVILHIESKKPQDWAKIEKKFDPTGELTKAFKKNTE